MTVFAYSVGYEQVTSIAPVIPPHKAAYIGGISLFDCFYFF